MDTLSHIIDHESIKINMSLLGISGVKVMKTYKIMILLSYICVASFSATLITPALPAIGHFYSINSADLSWVVSIFLIGYVVGQLIYGPLAKSFGALKALKAGLILNIVGILVSLTSVRFINFDLLLVGRLLTALGAASGLACTFMLMHELLNEKEYKHAMSYTVLAFTLGIGMAVFLGGIITQYLHWQMCFWLLLVHGMTVLALTLCFSNTRNLTNKQSIHFGVIIGDYWKALSNLQLIKYSLLVGFVSAFSYAYAAIAPLYVHSDLHMNPAQYGYWNGINMVGMLLGGVLGGKLMKKYGAKMLLQWGLIGFFPCCFLLVILAFYSLNYAVLFFIITAAMYLFGGFLFPSASFFAMASSKDKANASSMMSFVNMLTAVLAVIIAGHLPVKPILSFALLISMMYVFCIALVLSKRSSK